MRPVKKSLRSAASVLALGLLILLGTQKTESTSAYLPVQSQHEDARQSRNGAVTVREICPDKTALPGVTRTREVSCANQSSGPVFVRMAFSERWSGCSEQKSGDTGVEKNWTAAFFSDWEKKDDGWYYYMKVLPAGGTTENILSSISFPQVLPEGMDYELDLQAESVPCSADVGADAGMTALLFGKTGTVNDMRVHDGVVISGTVSWE